MLAQWLAISGVIARGRGDSDNAELYCSQALAGMPSQHYGSRLLCLSTLANLAVVRGDLWRARGLNREALELAQRHGNPLFEAFCHYDRGRVLLARELIGRRSYKSDDRARQTPERLAARRAVLDGLRAGRSRLGLRLVLSRAHAQALVAEGSGDRLDAALCLVEAAWGAQRAGSLGPGFGLPQHVDPLEGWIVGA